MEAAILSWKLKKNRDSNGRHDGVYVLCTECGNNMNAENMDKLLANWNDDEYKEPGSKESLTDANEKLKNRNERLAAENARLYKKLEEYENKHLMAEIRRLKTLVEELKKNSTGFTG